ncbi:nuclear transport factor 2 family protein [Alteromonas sp. H39]|uniref:nuclear transport factor 2 family protein n=1 Tax=Alteromonas sp. H39 TaxID=3389876 RepID=UPI0039DF935E
MLTTSIRRAWILAAASLLSSAALANPSLSDVIKAQDKALFDAFNQCQPDIWRRYLDENVEFYQDNDDPTFTRSELEPSFLDRCKEGGNANLIREFVPESHEVHPIQGVGAVQFGKHRFSLQTDSGEWQVVAEPRFVHLWENDGKQWRVIRVISYDH